MPTTAASTARTLRSVQQNAGDAVWQGSSADAFRDRIDKLPSHLDKLNASYSDAAAGLRAYAASVRQIATDARVQQ
ncbi:MAG: WXG100 family type VII secretion target [Jatrophihabitantaceae bacterium]